MKKIVILYSFSFFYSYLIAEKDFIENYYTKFNQAVQLYEEGRYRKAELFFKDILKYDRDSKDPACQLLIAKSQNRQGLWDEARKTCKSILYNYPESPYTIDTHILLGDCAIYQGKFTQAFKHYMNARPLIDDISYINLIDQRLYSSISLGLDEKKIEGLLFREKNLFNRSIINLARAYQAWLRGENYNLKAILNDIDTFHLPGKFASLYGNLLNKDNWQKDGLATIGVILPLSGNLKNVGQSYLMGIIGTINLSTMRLIVYDSAGSGANSFQIIKDINNKNDITAILGPLINEEIFSIIGTDLDIPTLVSGNAPIGVSKLNPNIFYLTPSLKTIAEHTAHLIIKEFGYKNIAVLSPGDNESKLITDYFLNECYQLGVDPVSIEWYVDTPINLSRQLKNIRKKAWSLIPEENGNDDFDNLEIDSLDALFDVDVKDFFKLPKEKENKMDKKDSSKIELATIEALYVPIRMDELTYIGTQLPFYNLKTTIFGNKNWLDIKMLNQEVIGPHIQGMHIVTDVNSISEIETDIMLSYYLNLSVGHIKYIENIINLGTYTRKQFFKSLRKYKAYSPDNNSINFSGVSKNENMVTLVLKYKQDKMNILGDYDGEKLIVK